MSSNWNKKCATAGTWIVSLLQEPSFHSKMQLSSFGKLINYVFVGGTCAIIDFGIFAFLIETLAVGWFFAGIASFIVATLVHYILSVQFVFQSGTRFNRQHEVALVFLVSAIGLAINQIVLYALIGFAGSNVLIAKLWAIAIVFFWNYSARLKFIFRSAPQDVNSEAL